MNFKHIRKNIIGRKKKFETACGTQKLRYFDWTASGRLYTSIEDKLRNEVAPFFANTHTEDSLTGAMSSKAYETSRRIIKEHVNAADDDVLILCGSGMTSAINKLQRILGLKKQVANAVAQDEFVYAGELTKNQSGEIDVDRPIVFVSHMEHHSNHTTWLDTIADVKMIGRESASTVDLQDLEQHLIAAENRTLKIVSISACSNVTGIHLPYRKIAKIAHRHSALCFVDFACSAPYEKIDMHLAESEDEHLDAIFFSMHKFLGGPGGPGVLIFNKSLYHCEVPDRPGGGTVIYTNPWGKHVYKENIEDREDGGTPAILQTIKAGMAIRLKEKMGYDEIALREEEMVNFLFDKLNEIENLEIFEKERRDRLAIISFNIKGLHYSLLSTILNDYFGIQVRSGCACAGTYGHVLLNVTRKNSEEILECLLSGDNFSKPGWVRASFHPSCTRKDLQFFVDAIRDVALNYEEYSQFYQRVSEDSLHWIHRDADPGRIEKTSETWFENI